MAEEPYEVKRINEILKENGKRVRAVEMVKSGSGGFVRIHYFMLKSGMHLAVCEEGSREKSYVKTILKQKRNWENFSCLTNGQPSKNMEYFINVPPRTIRWY